MPMPKALSGLLLVTRLFLRSSKVQRKRAALTVAGIAWGTVAIVLLLAFGEGLHYQLAKNKRGMGNHLAILWPNQTSRVWKGLPEGRPIRIRAEDIDLLRARVPGTRFCGEMQRWGVNFTRGDKTVNTHVRGVHWNYGDLRNQIPEPGGRFLNPIDEQKKRRVVFLGDELARDLFGTEHPVGRTVLVNEVPYTVIGVLVKKLMMGNYGGMDQDHAVIPITTFETQFGHEYLSVIVLRPDDPDAVEASLSGTKKALAGKYAFDPEDDKVFGIWNTVENSRVFDAMLIGIQLFLGIIGAMTLLIGGIGVANIMYAVVKERTREIGVKMALGARRGWITGPIVLEGLAFTLMGGVFGVLIAFSLVWLLSLAPTEGNMAIEMLGKPRLSIPIALSTAGILGCIGLVAGYFPARRAASIDPAETLRYE